MEQIAQAHVRASAAKQDLDSASEASARGTRILIAALISVAALICCFAIKIPVVG